MQDTAIGKISLDNRMLSVHSQQTGIVSLAGRVHINGNQNVTQSPLGCLQQIKVHRAIQADQVNF